MYAAGQKLYRKREVAKLENAYCYSEPRGGS